MLWNVQLVQCSVHGVEWSRVWCQLFSFIINIPKGELLFSCKNLKWKNITIKVRKKVRSVSNKDVKSGFADIGSCSRSLIISSIR